MLVKNLEAIEEENEDLFDSSNVDISQISAICLSKMTPLLNVVLLEAISNYSINKLQNIQTWKDKYCAFLALGAVLKEFEDNNGVLKFLEDKIEPLMTML